MAGRCGTADGDLTPQKQVRIAAFDLIAEVAEAGQVALDRYVDSSGSSVSRYLAKAHVRSEICRSRCVGSPHDRAASATPATVKTSAAICESPSGSCRAIVETTTPIAGTSIVPIAATEAGKRSTAPNQVT